MFNPDHPGNYPIYHRRCGGVVLASVETDFLDDAGKPYTIQVLRRPDGTIPGPTETLKETCPKCGKLLEQVGEITPNPAEAEQGP